MRQRFTEKKQMTERTVLSGLSMLGLAAAALGVALVAFERRDLRG